MTPPPPEILEDYNNEGSFLAHNHFHLKLQVGRISVPLSIHAKTKEQANSVLLEGSAPGLKDSGWTCRKISIFDVTVVGPDSLWVGRGKDSLVSPIWFCPLMLNLFGLQYPAHPSNNWYLIPAIVKMFTSEQREGKSPKFNFGFSLWWFCVFVFFASFSRMNVHLLKKKLKINYF